MNTISGIYRILNTKTGKYYIGKSVDVNKRFGQHKSDLNCGRHHCIFLQRAWNKYGSDSFVFELVQECSDELQLTELEQNYLDNNRKELYNTSYKSSGGDLISYHPNKDDIVARMTDSVKARYASMSEEDRANLSKKFSGQNNGMFGKTHSEEAKKAMSENRRDYTGSENPFFGKEHSLDTKLKLRQAATKRAKPIVIDGVEFPSIKEATRQLGINKSTIANRIKSSKYPNYFFKS